MFFINSTKCEPNVSESMKYYLQEFIFKLLNSLVDKNYHLNVEIVAFAELSEYKWVRAFRKEYQKQMRIANVQSNLSLSILKNNVNIYELTIYEYKSQKRVHTM